MADDHPAAVRPDPYTAEGLAYLLSDTPAYRKRQVAAWLARGVDDPAQMTDLPKPLRTRLAEAMPPQPRIVAVREADRGLTRKVLLECRSSGATEAVESVLMLYPKTPARAGRATVCISTQAGCAMGCPFCATGQVGFRRQLGLGETVRQVTVMQQLLSGDHAPGWPDDVTPPPDDVPDHVTNVVFMGMGEPLANPDVTLAAVEWLHHDFGLSARSITVSTIGLVPGIRRLQALELPVRLAVSLHAPNDALRDDLVPANKQHPLGAVLAATREYLESTGRRVTLEYVMIDRVNTAIEQAHELASLLRRHLPRGGAHVNLIPMNPTPAVPWQAPPVGQQRAFAEVLTDAGLAATIRANRGDDIDAACGQLYASYQMASGRIMPQARGAAERISAATGVPLPRVTGEDR